MKSMRRFARLWELNEEADSLSKQALGKEGVLYYEEKLNDVVIFQGSMQIFG